MIKLDTTVTAKITTTCSGIVLTKTTASQNEVALSYHSVRGLYFLAVVFAEIVVIFAVQYQKI